MKCLKPFLLSVGVTSERIKNAVRLQFFYNFFTPVFLVVWKKWKSKENEISPICFDLSCLKQVQNKEIKNSTFSFFFSTAFYVDETNDILKIFPCWKNKKYFLSLDGEWRAMSTMRNRELLLLIINFSLVRLDTFQWMKNEEWSQ